ncbi:helix-turn-helix domain-containing protein [Pseudomonas sp. LB3P81]
MSSAQLAPGQHPLGGTDISALSWRPTSGVDQRPQQTPVQSNAAAHYLDIVHTPPTIHHLTRQGWGFRTRWCYQAARRARRPHRVGLYVLTQEND